MTLLDPAWSPRFWGGWTAPKSEAAADENEDAFAAVPGRGVFAVADGATQSGFAAQWARLLVDGYTAADARSGDWIATQRQSWATAVDHLDVPWFMTERRDRGAYAAFLGVSLTAEPGGQTGGWAAAAIGDACVFHIRGDQLRMAWPIAEANGFNNNPPLIGSRADNISFDVTDGEWQAGDYLLLMTDAMACWFLTQTEKGRDAWRWLKKMIESPHSKEHFQKVVASLRGARKLKDDDTTLVAVGM